MSQEMDFVFVPGETDAHEYLCFDRKPNDPNLVAELQMYCVSMVTAAVLTRVGCTSDRMEMAMTLVVDGVEYTDEDMAALYDGIVELANAESFSIDVRYRGRLVSFRVWCNEDEDGDYSHAVKLPCPRGFEAGLFAYMRQYMKSENFLCKRVEYLPLHDGYSVTKIVDGAYADIFDGASIDAADFVGGDWVCPQMSVGVNFDTEAYADAAEALRDAVRRHLPKDELPFVEDLWEEHMDEGEHCVALLNGSYWSDLPALADFFAEVNGILKDIPLVERWSNDNMWYDLSRFAVAKLANDVRSFRVEANRF